MRKEKFIYLHLFLSKFWSLESIYYSYNFFWGFDCTMVYSSFFVLRFSWKILKLILYNPRLHGRIQGLFPQFQLGQRLHDKYYGGQVLCKRWVRGCIPNSVHRNRHGHLPNEPNQNWSIRNHPKMKAKEAVSLGAILLLR